MQPSFYGRLCCPLDRTALDAAGGRLTCRQGHTFPVVDGVPVMLVKGPQTQWVAEASINAAEQAGASPESLADPYFTITLGLSTAQRETVREEMRNRADYVVDPVVRHAVFATCGYLYSPLVGRLNSYPIPEMPLPQSDGDLLLDVGCNWGRWSIAAARKGYHPIGIDPSLGAILAARRASRDCGVAADFVVADARFLPFPDGTFDAAFSYSVLQHFSKHDATVALKDMARVLKPSGTCLVQMANVLGIRCLYHQARRRFRAPTGFDVRYWTPGELKRTFTSAIGRTTLSAEGFLGTGIRPTDKHLMPAKYRFVIDTSEFLRHLSTNVPGVKYLADSLWAASVRTT